jgi:hypothetical protein
MTDPETTLNAAQTYEEHAAEMPKTGRTAGTTAVVDASVRVCIPSIWTRTPNNRRTNSCLFPKLKSATIGSGDLILLPQAVS